jgi:hypothetical protein
MNDKIVVSPSDGEKCICCRLQYPDFEGCRRAINKCMSALRKVKFPGWHGYVWHNIVWHWNLYSDNGYMTLSEYKGKFSSLLTLNPAFWHSGSHLVTDGFKHSNPNKVIEHQLEFARVKINNRIKEFKRALRVFDLK